MTAQKQEIRVHQSIIPFVSSFRPLISSSHSRRLSSSDYQYLTNNATPLTHNCTTMTSTIAPPASFGLISGTAFASASPAALEKILDSLDISSLEQEHARLERAIQQLEQSNQEITEFIELEQQELLAHHQEHGSGNSEEANAMEPDPEFVLAIEENKVVIAKYQRTSEQLWTAIQRRRAQTEPAEGSYEAASTSYTSQDFTSSQDGVYL